MRLFNRAADALLTRLVPSRSAQAAGCTACAAIPGCAVAQQYKTDNGICATYTRCCYSGGRCSADNTCTAWRLCGNFC